MTQTDPAPRDRATRRKAYQKWHALGARRGVLGALRERQERAVVQVQAHWRAFHARWLTATARRRLARRTARLGETCRVLRESNALLCTTNGELARRLKASAGKKGRRSVERITVTHLGRTQE